MSGNIAQIDLSIPDISIFAVHPEGASKLLGGRGLSDWILYREMKESGDPQGLGNVLVLSNGLLAGTIAPGSIRLHIGGKSPQTGFLGYANVGGTFGSHLHRSGLQGAVIKGAAQRLSLVYFREGDAVLLDGEPYRGLTTGETEKRIRKDFGEDLDCLVIGPAGENLAPFSVIRHGPHNTAARSGMGALMGSMNLKALVVPRGKGGRNKDAAAVAAVREYLGYVKASPRYGRFASLGVSECAVNSNEAGVLGIRNFNDQQDDRAVRISGEKFSEYVTRLRGCYGCPVRCKADVQISGGKYRGYRGARPEWETVSSLGFKCGLFDAEQIMRLSDLCNSLGIDTVSTGGVLAFGMDLYQKGIVTDEDTGGISLTWGNAPAMEEVIRQIALRTGFGKILGMGVKRAAEHFGRGSEDFAYHVKGMEVSTTDPRSVKGAGLGYAVCSRGADFNNVYAIPEQRWPPQRGREQFGSDESVDRRTYRGKEDLIKRSTAVCAALDCLGLCKIPSLSLIGDFDLEKEAALVRGVTQLELRGPELLAAGERALHLERLLNISFGLTPADDQLPERFIGTPVPSGPNKGLRADRAAEAVTAYYRAMGWTDQGVPGDEVLRSSGLDSLLEISWKA
jgi:aldehyde:ferredoxin oxidoreductase